MNDTSAETSLLNMVPPHVPPERVFDFDLFYDPRLEGGAQQAHMSLHEDAPDIFYTPRNGGHWMATRFADVTRIMTNPQLFSSRGAFAKRVKPEQRVPIPPQDMDAPDHMQHRLLLLKFLGPKEINKLEPKIRGLINELIDELGARRETDFKAAIAVPMPVKIFMDMMGMDLSRYRECVGWVHHILGLDSPERVASYRAMNEYLGELIQMRIEHPGDDPVSILLRSEIQGERLSVRRVQEMCNLLFLAGLDTVTNAMSFIMQFLATNPDAQHYLRERPERIPSAVEEFLRRFSFVSASRRVAADMEFGGVVLKEDETIVCSFAAASNDDRALACPERVAFDRPHFPHLGFNTGPHICAGAPLARLELRIFLEEWLRRMPDVSLAPNFVAQARGGSVMSLDRLDIVW